MESHRVAYKQVSGNTFEKTEIGHEGPMAGTTTETVTFGALPEGNLHRLVTRNLEQGVDVYTEARKLRDPESVTQRRLHYLRIQLIREGYLMDQDLRRREAGN